MSLIERRWSALGVGRGALREEERREQAVVEANRQGRGRRAREEASSREDGSSDETPEREESGETPDREESGETLDR